MSKLKYYSDEEQEVKANQEIIKLKEAIESEIQNRGGDTYQARPFPSVSFLQKLSKDAYDSNCKIDEPWLQLKNIYSGKNSLKARICINTADRQLVIAFKGTTWYSLRDWSTNYNSVFMGKEANSHCNSAATVGAKARRILEQFHGRVHLIITGHSLGGYLAQLAAFAAQNLCIENGKFQTVDLDKCIEIYSHTVVFDSPPAADRIMQSTFGNPIKSIENLRLDVTNYIKSANIINFYSATARHLGELIFVEDDDSNVLRFLNCLQMKHALRHFETVDTAKKYSVTDLCNLITEPLDESIIPSMTFSKREFEELQVLPLLKVIHSTIIAKQINFNICNNFVKVFDEKADSFVPRMRLFLLENRKLLKDHVQQIDGFQSLIASDFWKMLYADFQDLDISLKPEYTQALLDSKCDVQVKCDKPIREKTLLAQIIRNSIPNTYFLTYKHYKKFSNKIVHPFLSNFKGHLILILEDDDKFEVLEGEIAKTCKFITLSKCAKTTDNILKALENVSVDIISAESKSAIEETKVKFFDTLVPIKEICTVLPSDVDLIEILDFALSHSDIDGASTSSQFYVQQKLFSFSQDKPHAKVYKTINDLIDLMASEKSFIILSSKPGMGKTTFFGHLQAELTKNLTNNWIVKINLLEQSQYLKDLVKLTGRLSIEQVVEFIKQTQKNGRTAFQMYILENLIKTKQVVVIIDAFDEICPLYRKITLRIIAKLKSSRIRFAVSTRPQELEQIQKKLNCKEHLELLEIERLEDFIKQYFVMKEKLQPDEAQNKANSLLRQFSNDSHNYSTYDKLMSCWRIPLHALMVAELYAKSPSSVTMSNISGLFEQFVVKRIERDLEEKMNLDPNHPKQFIDFEKRKKRILDSLMQLAMRENFTEYREQNVGRFAAIRKKDESDINSTGIATIMKSSKVQFSHHTFSEYLSIKFCLLNLQDNQVREMLKQILVKKTHLMKRIFLNEIVGNANSVWPPSFKDLVQEHSSIILLRICKDDLLEVFRLLRRSGVSFDYDRPQRVDQSQDMSMYEMYDLPSPSKKARIDYDDSDFFDNDVDFEDDIEDDFEDEYSYGDFGYFDTFPVTLAIKRASENLVLELISDGADLSKVLYDPISNYEDILSHAVFLNMFNVVKKILEIRPLENEPDYKEMCIIHWAVRAGNLKILRILVEAGANIFALDENGFVPFNIAHTKGDHQIIKFLEEQIPASSVVSVASPGS